MVDKLTDFKHFRVVEEWEKRVEIITPVLKDDDERAYVFQILLKKRPEIRQIQVVVETGFIIIDFDPDGLTKKNLFIAMDAVLGNIEQKPRKKRAPRKKHLTGHLQEISLLVEGMSCPACAALIAIALKKDSRIEDASADLKTKEVNVYGLISKAEVIDKIEQLGYKHIVDAK